MAKYVIAENGESLFHIVNHQYCDETIRYAATELQKYLLKSTNAALPYFSDRTPKRGPEIRIGPFVRGETVVEENLHDEGFVIRGNGENITITGKTSRGVLYGVYRFIEIFCNFRCFTKDAETIDKVSKLEIELTEIVEEPDFDFRDSYFRNAFDGDFCAKNRLNSNFADISVAKGGRMKWFNFHHSFNDLVSDKIYFDEHPEYFSEREGVRVKDSQLCLTNPDVLKIAEESLRKWIKENPECKVFSVAQDDNWFRCTCPECMKLEKEEGSPAGPIIHFVNKLAESIKKDYPDILLHTFAYQYSLPAPKKVIANDNVIVRLCSISCRFDKTFSELATLNPEGEEAIFLNALNDWQSHAKRLFVWDYAVNFRNYFQPFLHFSNLTENIKLYKKIGVNGVFEQGNFAYGGGASCDDLKAYLISRLLWNTNVDVKDEMHRFCVGVYGEKAAEYFEEYLEIMEKACQSAPMNIYQDPDTKYITDEVVEKSKELFENAIAVADNETYRQRVEREYLAIRFLILTRMEFGTQNRTEMINQFFDDVKKFGITEIRERRSLKVSKDFLLTGRYTRGTADDYAMRYIMQ